MTLSTPLKITGTLVCAAAVLLTVALAIGFRFFPATRGYQFTMWIIAAVTAAMIYPAHFLKVGGFDISPRHEMTRAGDRKKSTERSSRPRGNANR